MATGAETERSELGVWAWNSHWWIEYHPGYSECKWCGMNHTSEMGIGADFPLCLKNPRIEKLVEKECVEKPPLGLRPKFIIDGQRRREIKGAIERYRAAKKLVPVEWIEELETLATAREICCVCEIEGKNVYPSESCPIHGDWYSNQVGKEKK